MSYILVTTVTMHSPVLKLFIFSFACIGDVHLSIVRCAGLYLFFACIENIFLLSLAYWENAYLLLACCGNNHFSFRLSFALLSFISVVTIYAGFGLASFLVPSFFTFLIIGFTVYQILILLFMEALKSYDAKKSKLSETAYPVQWYDLMKLSKITITSNHQECDWMYLTWSSAPNTEIYS